MQEGRGAAQSGSQIRPGSRDSAGQACGGGDMARGNMARIVHSSTYLSAMRLLRSRQCVLRTRVRKMTEEKQDRDGGGGGAKENRTKRRTRYRSEAATCGNPR